MRLEKKDFTRSKYNELVNYANSNNMIIVDKGTYYETVEIKEPEKTLEELKEEKKEELKQARQDYKKTVYLKDDYSIDKFEPLSCYNYYNLNNLKFGWTQADKDKFENIIEYIGTKYDEYKLKIKQAKNKEELDKIQFTF